MTPACCLAQFGLELVVQSLVGGLSLLARAAISFLRAAALAALAMSGRAGGEEFLFLEFDPLPGRVADDAGEAAGPAGGWVDVGGAVADAEDVRELDMPVEEPVLAGQIRDQVLGGGQVQRVGAGAELLQDRLGDRGGAGFLGLGLDEGGAPGVGEQLLDAAFGEAASSAAWRCW